MWFRQVQFFHLTKALIAGDSLNQQLAPFTFTPCLPSFSYSLGWTPPIDEEEAPLSIALNSCSMIALKIEEKILPASVIRDQLKEKIKLIEKMEARKLSQREKLALKDEVVQTLLPRAFSKFTTLHAYIDPRNHWLILNNTTPKRVEQFLSLFKKSFGDCIELPEVVKPATLMTHWLKTQSYPNVFSIHTVCMLQDPSQQTRTLRCQQQNLFSQGMQALLKEGYEAVQLGLCWDDRLQLVLANDFTLRSVQKTEEEAVELKDSEESTLQRFTTDFLLMMDLFTGLINDLLALFEKTNEAEAEAVTLTKMAS